MSRFPYQVFLSHSSADKPAVEELALWLVRTGVTPFLDKWDLVPGEDWTEALPAALGQSATCAVILGPGDKGGWQSEEVKQSLIRRVRERNKQAGDRFRIIPVLLPGASAPGADEPSAFDFLAEYTWVKFEKSLDEEAPRHRLVCGIRGVAPGPRTAGPIAAGECPYRGLDVFDVAHAGLFFGREKLTGDLVGMLGTILRVPGTRLLAVVGPSGSGKSSIVRAGLIPVLQQGALEGSETWKRLIFKPGQDPFENLGIALATLPDSPGLLAGARDVLNIARFGIDHDRSLQTAARLAIPHDSTPERLLVVVDQFEEVFTQCGSEEVRRKFIANLVEAAKVPGGPVVVILSMRADFIGKCASYRDLADAISARQKLVGEMVDDEFRWAVEKPAALAGGEIEPGLVELILRDVGSEPGSLPLLEFALSELWKHKTGRRMRTRDYHEIGGLQGALRNHAETVFEGLKDRGSGEICRRIFLDLIEPGKESADTRRRVRYRQLAVSADWTSVLETLVFERLVTADQPDELIDGTVEIVHESLIKYWPRLQDWVIESRESLEIRSDLENAADQWIEYQRDSDSLLRGLPLANALEWARSNPDDLDRLALVRDFLDDSQATETRREQNELEQERHLREQAEAAVLSQKKLSRASLITTTAVMILAALVVWYEVAGRRLVDGKRRQARQSVASARQAMFQGDWSRARTSLANALTLIDREPSLADEISEARRLRDEVDQKLAEQEARRTALARRGKFDRLHDEVLFLATQFADADSSGFRERAKKAAKEAFAAVGLVIDGPGRPILDRSFDPVERDAILSGGYELLLVLADALAQPLSGQALEDRRSSVDEALVILERAAALKPPTRAYHLRKARCLTLQGDEPGARRQREAADALPTAGFLEAFLAGVDLFLVGPGSKVQDAQAKAIQCFEQALRSQPDHFWARYYLAACLINAGRPQLATVHLTDCLGRHPGYAWIYLLRGFAHSKLHEFDAAEADFGKAWEFCRDDDARYALFVNRAEYWLGQGRREEAAKDLESAVRLKPDRYRAHFGLALLSKGDHRFEEAATHLEKAIGLHPPDLVMTTLRVEQAHLLLLTGWPEEALDACNELGKARPDSAEILGVRATSLLELEDFPGSNRDFTLYLERGGPPTADIYRGRGHSRMKLGDFPGAVDDYTEALRLEPDSEGWTHRGWAHFFAGAYRLALRDFDAALQLKSSSVETLIGRGLALVSLEQDSRAIMDADKVLEQPPDDPVMLVNLACIFGRAAGRQDPVGDHRRKALEVLQRTLERLPALERKAFWEEHVLREDYLDAIKESPEFLELGKRAERGLPSVLP